jgi:thiol-disulfide isomerase/thioredoxin
MENLNERNTAKYSFLIIILSCAIFIAADAGSRLQTPSTGSQSTPEAHPTLPDFKLENIAGGFITSDDLKGKVTVVDVWATWCGSCTREIPIYTRLYDAFQGQDEVAFVGIATDSPRKDIPVKVRQLGIPYPVFIGGADVIDALRIQGFPTTFVLDKEGNIYKRYMGTVANKEDKIRQDIEHLLKEDFPLS